MSQQNTTKFKPTPTQRKMVEVLLENDEKLTITGLCKELDIDRSTYYNWFKNDDFVEWFNKTWRREITRNMVKLDIIGLNKASEDFRYWEAMQIKYGGYSRVNKHDTAPQDNVIRVIYNEPE